MQPPRSEVSWEGSTSRDRPSTDTRLVWRERGRNVSLMHCKESTRNTIWNNVIKSTALQLSAAVLLSSTAVVPQSWAWHCPGWSCVFARRCRVWWAALCGCWRKRTPAASVAPASRCPTYCHACPPPPWSHALARPHWQTGRQAGTERQTGNEFMQPALIYVTIWLLQLQT